MQNDISELYEKYKLEQKNIIDEININEIERIVVAFKELASSNKNLWIAGNGGSASTASHLVTDFSKGVTNAKNRLKTYAISDFTSLITAIANDISYDEIFSKTLELYANEGDGLLILSVSGTSNNLIKTLDIVKNKDLRLFTILGSRGIQLNSEAEVGIILNSNDYQIVENIHLIIGHLIHKMLNK
jgi:D-sedoheptulose 7-phosphate isomerase